MTKQELITHLAAIPDDARIMSNSGWEANETKVDGIWYSPTLNEVHLTQGGKSETKDGYSYAILRYNRETRKVDTIDDFQKLYCKGDK